MSLVFAETSTDPYKAIRLSMRASIEKQRQSVRRQLDYVHGVVAASGTSAVSSVVVPVAPVESVQSPVATVEPVQSDCAPIPPSQLMGYIERTAEREGLTPDLLRAVIDKESRFQPCAVSKKGAQGLMQLMPTTAAQLDVADPFDPKENIAAGARFLGQLLARYGGNIELALGAYNAGPTRIDTYRGLPPIPETLNYVSDIMDSLRVEPLAPMESMSIQPVAATVSR